MLYSDNQLITGYSRDLYEMEIDPTDKMLFHQQVNVDPLTQSSTTEQYVSHHFGIVDIQDRLRYLVRPYVYSTLQCVALEGRYDVEIRVTCNGSLCTHRPELDVQSLEDLPGYHKNE
jgi:hypothetical protein